MLKDSEGTLYKYSHSLEKVIKHIPNKKKIFTFHLIDMKTGKKLLDQTDMHKSNADTVYALYWLARSRR